MKTINLNLALDMNREPSAVELDEVVSKVNQLLRTPHMYEHFFGKSPRLLSVRGHKVTSRWKPKSVKLAKVKRRHKHCDCFLCKQFGL